VAAVGRTDRGFLRENRKPTRAWLVGLGSGVADFDPAAVAVLGVVIQVGGGPRI
jgi:hypothetical protein